MYINWLCPVWVWIDPDLSSQLAFPLAGLTHGGHAAAGLHHCSTSNPLLMPPRLPLCSSLSHPSNFPAPASRAASSPRCSVSDPSGCPARDAQCPCLCVCVFYPRSAASSLLLVMQCHPLAEPPRIPPLQLFSAIGDAPKMKY